MRSPGGRALLTLRLTRFPFIAATLPTIFMTSAVVFAERGTIDFTKLLVTTVGLLSAHLASNTANDYWDAEVDAANRGFSRFSGGSRTLTDGLLTKGYARNVSLALYILAFSCGLFLAYTNIWVLPLMGLGFFLSYFYTAPPFRLGYHYIGEVVVGVSFGWLMAIGVYIVQYPTLSLTIHLLSLIPSTTVAMILLINEFPDYDYDKASQKNNLLMLLGKRRGAVLYSSSILSVYLALALYVATGLVRAPALLGLLALPLALFAGLTIGVKRGYEDPRTLDRVQGTTILVSVATSVLIGLGFLL